MKLFYSICICLLLSISSLLGQGQDIVFLKGKDTPLKGEIINSGGKDFGDNGKLFFIRENKRSPKFYKLEKIQAVLTKEHKLYIDPAISQTSRDLASIDYGVIFLHNGKSIAITSWEVAGAQGEIEYVDFFTGESAIKNQHELLAVYSKEPELQVFGEKSLTFSRLKTAMLPLPPAVVDRPNKLVEEEVKEEKPPVEKVEVKIDDNFQAEEETELDGKSTGPAMPVDMDEFNEKAKLKVEKFASYVKTILEGEDRMRIRSIIDQALILFISDTCYIEVSSLNRPQPTSYNIRRYFNRLNYLADKYTKIEVTDGKVVKVSDIRKYKDKWYGTVTYGQRFSGYKDGILIYTDYTQKNINIVLKVYEPEIEGQSKAIWDVLLSNISVTETSQ